MLRAALLKFLLPFRRKGRLSKHQFRLLPGFPVHCQQCRTWWLMNPRGELAEIMWGTCQPLTAFYEWTNGCDEWRYGADPRRN